MGRRKVTDEPPASQVLSYRWEDTRREACASDWGSSQASKGVDHDVEALVGVGYLENEWGGWGA